MRRVCWLCVAILTSCSLDLRRVPSYDAKEDDSGPPSATPSATTSQSDPSTSTQEAPFSARPARMRVVVGSTAMRAAGHVLEVSSSALKAASSTMRSGHYHLELRP